MAFSEILLDHFQSPRNEGGMEQPDGEAAEFNPVCGDRVCVRLRIEGDIVREMRWEAEGCAPSIAAASITSEMVRGLPVDEARRIDRERIAEALGGLPVRKAHAALLVAGALGRAIDGYRENSARLPIS